MTSAWIPNLPRMRNATLITLALFTTNGLAQERRADIDAVQRSGLHLVRLDPAVAGLARNDLGDLRIMDKDGKEIPYRVRVAHGTPHDFVPYTILRNEVLPKRTLIELEPPARSVTDQLFLWVRNAETEKRVRITGSDDRQRWFMVKDTDLALRGTRGDPTHQVLMLELPHTGHRYLRLDLNDSLTAPVQVLKVGAYQRTLLPARMVRDTGIRWTRTDSAHTTTLLGVADHALLLDRLVLLSEDTLPYQRKITAWTRKAHTSGRGRKQRTLRADHFLDRFTLASTNGGAVDIEGLRADTLILRIDNGNDRAISWTDVQGWQRERMVEAFLEPGKSYHLIVGGAERKTPLYDATPFIAHEGSPADTLAHGVLLTLPGETPARPPLDPSQAWVWIAIIVLASMMTIAAWRMLRNPATRDP
jgi:hypothetical protein